MNMNLSGKTKRMVVIFFSNAVRIGLGCILIWSSLPKIRQSYDFLSSIYSYELLGPKLGMFVAMTLPWLELLVGICLVGGIFVSGALLVSIGLALMFTFVLGTALARGLQISCGCFGTSNTDIISVSTLIRACVILMVTLLAYICLMFSKKKIEVISTE
jgi:putative oxidoreductase